MSGFFGSVRECCRRVDRNDRPSGLVCCQGLLPSRERPCDRVPPNGLAAALVALVVGSVVLVGSSAVQAQKSNLYLFDQELQQVSPSASFTITIDPDFGEDEWSVDGFALRAGSHRALASAASEALYAMGFRYYTPRHAFYPAKLTPTKISRRAFTIPHRSIWLAYGHDRRSQAGKLLKAQYDRWAILNDVAGRDWPAGHTWKRIIRAFKAEYAENPGLLRGPRTFELDDPDAYQRNVELSARYISRNLNKFGRHAFDPSDSDKYPSETIYRFARDVVAEVRKTVPHAQLGVYAYAGHRLPVTFKLPGIYIQVALAFNRTKYSYQELVDAHARVADAIMLREYFDVQAWFHSRPVGNVRNQRHYYETHYPGFLKSGVRVVNGEFHENWLANVVGINYAMRYFRDGTTRYETVLDEIVARMFGGDPAVRDLYMLWSTPKLKFNEDVLRQSIAIVARMKQGWHRTAFEQYMVIVAKTHELGKKGTPGYGGAAERSDVERPCAGTDGMDPLLCVRATACERERALRSARIVDVQEATAPLDAQGQSTDAGRVQSACQTLAPRPIAQLE